MNVAPICKYKVRCRSMHHWHMYSNMLSKIYRKIHWVLGQVFSLKTSLNSFLNRLLLIGKDMMCVCVLSGFLVCFFGFVFFFNCLPWKIIFPYFELKWYDFCKRFIFFSAWQVVGETSPSENTVLLHELEQEQKTVYNFSSFDSWLPFLCHFGKVI